MTTCAATTQTQRKCSRAVLRAPQGKLKLCPLVTNPWGVQQSCYDSKGDEFGAPAVSRVGPWGISPARNGDRVAAQWQSAAALRRRITTQWLCLHQGGGKWKAAVSERNHCIFFSTVFTLFSTPLQP